MNRVVVYDKMDVPLDFSYLNKWLDKCVIDGWKLKQLTYHLVSDDELLEVNKKFLNHDYYTDIISFDYSLNKKIKGECWISWDRVMDNATKERTSIEEELNRVFVHGLLHFMEFNDSTEEEQAVMRIMESKCLELL